MIQYVDLIFYLKNGYAPPKLKHKRKRDLRLKEIQYEIIDDVVFKRNCYFVLLRCLEKLEAQKISLELHDGPTSGHFGGNTTAHKIFHIGYYWPSLFKDIHEYIRK